jgi:hypothetical protein
MNLRENIRRILKEEVKSADMKTVQTDLVNMMGKSDIKDGDRIKIVDKLIAFNSSFRIIVDRLDQVALDEIVKLTKKNGWFPIAIGLSDMDLHRFSNNFKDYIGEEDVEIEFEANESKGIDLTETKAFHVTPDIFIDQIKQSGLTLKSESKLADHPDRIYLFLNDEKDMPKNMAGTLWNSLSVDRQKTIKKYYVLEIDLTKIPNHEFYIDPQTMVTYKAIYTTEPIPASAIKVIDEINTSDLKTNSPQVKMSKDEEKRKRSEKRKEEEERIEKEKKDEALSARLEKMRQQITQLPPEALNKLLNIDVSNLEESIKRILREDKTLKLLSNIKENGLYEVISSTGLHINQVEQKVGQLSREVLERFITDVLKEHGEFLAEETQTYTIDLDGWPLDAVPIANDAYIERIRTTNDELLFTVVFYEENEFRDLEEASYEIMQSKKFKYDNIYEIAGQLAFYLAKGKL